MADNNQQNKGGQPAEEQDVGRLRQVRRDKLKELQDAGKDPFQIVKYDQTHHTQEIRDNVEKLETVLEVGEDGKTITPSRESIPAEKIVSIAGRMMSKRVMGKASFAMFRIETDVCRYMFHVTILAMKHMLSLSAWISVIS